MSPPAASMPADGRSPLLTHDVHTAMRRAALAGIATIRCSLDLGRSQSEVVLETTSFSWRGRVYPYLEACKERTIYFWDGESFQPASRYTNALIKLVPTQWGAPTFEIDGIKMLPTLRVSPYEDAGTKVALIQPRDKEILDTCGGLGYFAAWCLRGGAGRIVSFEKNPDVMWLRTLNPWSPEGSGEADSRLEIEVADVAARMAALASASFAAVLHDPPRFGIAGELYSQAFYDELARVLKRNGKLFHYTGTPNKLTTGRDVPTEVANRLRRAGFSTEMKLDGVLAVKRR